MQREKHSRKKDIENIDLLGFCNELFIGIKISCICFFKTNQRFGHLQAPWLVVTDMADSHNHPCQTFPMKNLFQEKKFKFCNKNSQTVYILYSYNETNFIIYAIFKIKILNRSCLQIKELHSSI